jgi:hypothetical protein
MYDKVELRLDDFLYAVAPTGAGLQHFALAPGVNGLTVTGSYVAHNLEVSVSGLAATNGTYMGMLYLPNPDGTVQSTPTESFPIGADGTFKYESKAHVIGDFVQFHVHFGESKLNLYKAKITPDT